MSEFRRVVPVLQVVDVERSIAWYAHVFGFRADPFPPAPPYSFAMLTRDDSEIMLQCGPAAQRTGAKNAVGSDSAWALYVRTSGDDLLELATAVGRATPLLRGPERMFYGLVEFEVLDPDGYRVCVSGNVPAGAQVPLASERERPS